MDNRVKSYDHMLHQSLDKIFSEHCLNDSEQIKEFLRGPQLKSIIKPILDQETILSRHFSKEEMGKLSLLWIAVLCCYEKSAELLVRSGADVNELFGRRDPQVIYEKWTVLYVLLQMKPSPENERLIRLVTDHGADLQARDYNGRTVLHHAVMRGRVQMTEMLLEKGVDVNAADNDGETSLLLAACNSKADELLPLLMKHGASVFAKSSNGENALHRLAYVSEDRAVNIARVLIDKGVSLDDRKGDGQMQPIHLVAMRGQNELVKLFLDHGANVNALTKYSESPLYLATMRHYNAAVLETLLKRGANIDLRTVNGRTALHAACEYAALKMAQFFREDYETIIRRLLSAGADLLAEDFNGKTPFALIASSENMENSSSIRPMIEMLALTKVTHPSVELKDERIIEQRPTLLNYYRKCTDEIDRLKSTRFIETCTFLQLLAKSYCQIAALMRNPKFESKFKQCDLNEFPIYNENLLRAFERAQKHFQPMLEQEDVISEVFYYTLPVLVVDKIVHYVFNCCENVK